MRFYYVEYAPWAKSLNLSFLLISFSTVGDFNYNVIIRMNSVPMSTIFREYQLSFYEESDGEDLLGNNFGPYGIPNRAFFYKLFLKKKEGQDEFYDFLEDCSLIASSMKCEQCGGDMSMIVSKRAVLDGRRWYCGKGGRLNRCEGSKSVRHNSYFTGSHLRITTILMMTFEIFQGSTFDSIHKDLGVYQHAVADWRRFATDVLVEYIETKTEKIGGYGKIVEIDESKIGKRKFNRGRFVEGQWVFGGVERDSGRCFMVAVPDRAASTLLDLIKMWIQPGTFVISDCWKSYERLSELDYDHLRVNHSLHFKDPVTGACTNTIESYWRHFKASLPEYNRQGDFGGYIAWFMFRQICNSLNVDPFSKFLDIIRGINWVDWHIV